MIFTKTLIVISMLTLSVSQALAANVDFKSIYNNDLESCSNNQTGNDCTNANESIIQCDTTKIKDVVANNEENNNKPCMSVKADNNYIEPKFSTKRPRGQ